ncbi:MAG TPA: hypothetical protein VFW74_03395, partial [Acidimicrobiia bacterium]|nr:hypothetical protein [Acidimicrobiia bacterium]
QPWALLRWIVPLLALVAPFVARERRRRVAVALLVVVLAGALLGKGLHPPLVDVNLWLYQHVPGMWLLREPMSKVGALILLAEILLAALTVGEALRRVKDATKRRRRAVFATLAVLVLLAAAFPFPLWLGRIGPDGNHGLPSARVAVPASWTRLAATLNAQPARGKVLVLPLDRYYQVTTTWGFHGADELVQQLLRQPVLQLMPDGYYSPSGDTTAMLHATEAALADGDGAKASTLLHALGVSTVVVRHDLARDQVLAPLVSPEAIVHGLARVAGVRAPQRFGVADVYGVSHGDQVWSPATIAAVGRRSEAGFVDAVAAAGPDTAVVAPGAIPVDRLSWEADDGPGSNVSFSLRHAGQYDVGLDDATPADWLARVRSDRSGAALTLSDPTTMLVDGERTPSAPTMTVPVDDPNVEALAIGATLVPMAGGAADVELSRHTHVVAYAASATSTDATRFSSAGFCGPHAGDANVRARTNGATVELTATGGRGCVTLPGPALSPDGVYRVRFETRSPSGVDPAMCVSQHGPGSCLTLPSLQASAGWRAHDVVVRSSAATTGLTVFLYAPATRGKPATVDYRNVSVEPLRATGRADVAPAPRPAQRRRLDAGEHQLTVERPRAAHALALDSVLGDCAATDARTPDETGLAVQRIPGGVRLRAAAHAACVTAPIPDAQAGEPYDVSLDVRTVAGRAARICIWQDGPNRCAATPAVPASDSWDRYRARVRLDPGTTAARVYVYADGQQHPSTVTEYRNVRVQPIRSEFAHVDPVAAPTSVTPVSWNSSGSGSFSAKLGHVGPALVVLDESFGTGWKLAGATGARHVVANGYANAWYLPAGATSRLSMNYAPSRLARFALLLSALGFVAAGVTLAFTAIRRRRRPRTPARQPEGATRDQVPTATRSPRMSTLGLLAAFAACTALVRAVGARPRRRR